jgi:hypothetical protein
VGVLFLTLGVLALQGKLHSDGKGTPRQLVRRSARADGRSSRCCTPLRALTLARRPQALALTILGSITFIPGALLRQRQRCCGTRGRALTRSLLPGFYYTRLAYYASKGYAGYSYDDIPEVE